MQKFFFFFLATVLCFPGNLSAQKKTKGTPVFERLAVRIVEDSFKNDLAEHHLREVNCDSSFLLMLLVAIREKKLIAYKTHAFKEVLTAPRVWDNYFLSDEKPK